VHSSGDVQWPPVGRQMCHTYVQYRCVYECVRARGCVMPYALNVDFTRSAHATRVVCISCRCFAILIAHRGSSSASLTGSHRTLQELENDTGHRFFGPAPQLKRPPPPSFFFLPLVSRATVSASSSRSLSNAAHLALKEKASNHHRGPP
jgi:hypothetical protein